MCIHTSSLCPKGGYDLVPPCIIDVLYCDLTPSLDLCNATDIKAKKIAKLTLRREQTRGKREASAGCTLPIQAWGAGTSPRRASAPRAVPRGERPPSPWLTTLLLKALGPAVMGKVLQCRAALRRLSAEAMEIFAAKLFSTWEALWDSGEIN